MQLRKAGFLALWLARKEACGLASSAFRHVGQKASGTRRQAAASSTAAELQKPVVELSQETLASLPEIKAVASDIDGTCTAPDLQVPQRVMDAIVATLDSGIVFFPATGKSRAGMMNTLGPAGDILKARGAPGVYIQGLVVYGPGPDSKVIYERLLGADIGREVAQFCRDRNMSLIAYSGDRIVCTRLEDKYVTTIADYHEPFPEAVGEIDEAMAAGLPVHKLIIMAPAEEVVQQRPALAQLLGQRASLVQAMPHMLEVLPLGASKGIGVAKLLAHMGFKVENLMAMGDAENDIEMLKMAAVSVAMGNADPEVKKVARFVAPTNAQEGAAVALETLLQLRPRQ
ncbi:HAD-like domain-containing protein [Tribonema minus]|uniref:HAD-like domain-containing protein n=1 Tax=Tribonema minus TaxID=303371 RepID=A0A836C834_9STRA|nr:HAD-like domain-containing protein [Tribonema minus]